MKDAHACLPFCLFTFALPARLAVVASAAAAVAATVIAIAATAAPASATTTTSTAATTVAAAPAAASVSLRSSFVDGHVATANVLAVEHLDCFGCFFG